MKAQLKSTEPLNKSLFIRVAMLLFACLLSLGNPSYAQTTNATILGTIVDSTGARVPGVAVTARNTDTGIATPTVSDASGSYSIPNLVIGSYEIQADKAGYSRTVRKGIALTIGRDALVDLSLNLGSTGETINVSGDAPLVETTDSSISAVIGEKQIRDLPLNGRDLQQLILVAPGVNQVNATGSPGTYTHGNASTYSIAGLRPVGMIVLQDGSDVSNFYHEGAGNMTANTSLGVESIAEFQTLTGNYSAEFGGQGAVVNQATRNGTNEIHGSLYGFYRSSAVNAKSYVFPNQSSVQPSFHKAQFGASVGGPLVRGKSFYFLNYEGLRASIGASALGTTLDSNARAGLLPCAVATTYTCNTSTGLASVGITATVAPYLQFFPVATGAEVLSASGAATGAAFFTGSGTTTQHEDYGTARIDQKFSEKDSLFGSYTIDNGTTIVPSLPILGNGSNEFGRNQYLALQESHTFSPSLLNLASLHFVRLNQTINPQLYGSQQPLLNCFGGQYATGSLFVSNLSTMNLGTINILGTNRFTYSDHLYWTVGKHSLKAGLDVARVQGNINEPLNGGGLFIFTTIANFFQGNAFEAGGAVPGSSDANRGFRETQVTPFLQDDYKVNSRLVVNLGIRYSFVTNPTESKNKLYALLDPATATAFTKVDRAFASNPSTRNWDPRVGFAYTPFSSQRTSVRGGLGIYHNLIDPRDLIGYAFGYPYLSQIPFTNNIGSVPFPNINPVPPSAPSINLTPLYTNRNTPYALVYNLGVQQQVGKQGVFTLGYVGSNGVHLAQSYDFNYKTTAGTYTDGRLYRPSGNAAVHVINPAAGSLLYETFNGNSHYDSLQASLRESFKSLQLLSSYTFATCLDYMSQPYSGDNLGESATGIFDPLNIHGNRGRCDYSVRHNFNVSGVYSMPSFGNRYLGGFQVTGILLDHSGLPYTPLSVGGRSNVTGSQASPADRVAGVSSGPSVRRTASGIYGLDPAAFTVQPFGVVGNAGRDSLNRAGYVDVDAGLMKNTPIPKISTPSIFNSATRCLTS